MSRVDRVERATDVTVDTDYGTQEFLYIGGAGTVQVTEPDGGTPTYTGLAVGIWHPIVTKGNNVIGAGTTATNIKVGN